jgi:hypothetical protein
LPPVSSKRERRTPRRDFVSLKGREDPFARVIWEGRICLMLDHRSITDSAQAFVPKVSTPSNSFSFYIAFRAERRLALDILVEYDFGTRQQANRNVRLPDRRESASNRVVKSRRHQRSARPPLAHIVRLNSCFYSTLRILSNLS